MFKHSHKAQTTQLASCFTSSLTLPHTNQVRSIAWECRWSWEKRYSEKKTTEILLKTTEKSPPTHERPGILPRALATGCSGDIFYWLRQTDTPFVGGWVLWCGDRILNATKTNRYFAVQAILRRFCCTEFAYQRWGTEQATNLTQDRYTKKLLCPLMAVADRLMIMIFLHYDTTDCVHTIRARYVQLSWTSNQFSLAA